jgi:hypothetical protein
MFLQNVSNYLPVAKAQCPRREEPSQTQFSEPQISQISSYSCHKFANITSFIQVMQNLMSPVKSVALKVESGFKSLEVNVLRSVTYYSDKHKTLFTKHSQSSLNQTLVFFWFKL